MHHFLGAGQQKKRPIYNGEHSNYGPQEAGK
jgi:hypothetical protein